MKLIIVVALIFLIALVGSRRTFARVKLPLGAQHIFLTGTEFIFVGLFLGGVFLNILDEKMIKELHPFLSLGLAWIGLLFGIQLDFRKLIRFPIQYFLVAMLQAIFTLLVVFFPFYFILDRFFPSESNLIFVALVLSAAAAPTAQSALALVPRDDAQHGRRLMRLLRYVSGMDGLVGLVILGFVLCFSEFHTVGGEGFLATWQWLLISIGLGVVIGFIFHVLTSSRVASEELLLVVLGMIIFSGGIALYLNLSPLFVNFIIGMVIANLSHAKNRIASILLSGEKSVYIIFLILVGATWHLGSAWAFALAGIYFVIRLIGKICGGYLATRMFKTVLNVPASVGLGLVSQGGMAIVIVINFQQVYHSVLTNVVVTMVLLATLVNEIISPALAQRVLKQQTT
ncbi:cation:proton antiporter [bacterium]|nr:cation:proton antiporter [bacterium]